MHDWNLLGPPVSKRATKVNGRTDGWTHGRMDGRTDGRADGRADRQTDAGDMVITKAL